LNLLRAIELLVRNDGLDIHLVCSGGKSDFFQLIEQEMDRLGIARRVHFLGFVTPLELQGLYRLSRLMVFPSKFEGWGLPISEAFLAGVPVASSNVTCLPEQAQDAAVLFDPDDYVDIASAIKQLWTNEPLRRDLTERGRDYASRLTWDRTARVFRALYRQLAGRSGSAEDQHLVGNQTSI
jgi:glycosyltransferase involved in cell wall biosynthesis